MAGAVKKSFGSPDERRTPDKTEVEVVDLGSVKAARMTLQPGWRWSECIKPLAGTESCQIHLREWSRQPGERPRDGVTDVPATRIANAIHSSPFDGAWQEDLIAPAGAIVPINLPDESQLPQFGRLSHKGGLLPEPLAQLTC